MRRFLRLVQQANNSTGADFLAEIKLRFNPAYETLTLHDVTIKRDGVEIDALDDADIDFLRVEQDMYARIYRGDYTVVIQVRGLEPGDQIEYAYTVDGQNPAFGEDVALYMTHTYSVPVARRYCRVLHAPGQAPLLHARGPELEITRRETSDGCELIYDKSDLPRFVFEDWAPPEFDHQASLWLLSSFRSWADVVAWANKLYDVAEDDATVAELAARFQAQREKPPELAAIAYVQDRIRYVSTGFGEGGYRPRAPEVIVKRRYGDCKDKALLLSAVLRKLGFEARPALVSARRPRAPLTESPSPLSFDHVVVRAIIEGEVCWIDATSTGQRGPMAKRGRPHGMAALPIMRGVDALELIPPLPQHLAGDFSDGVIDLSAGVGAAATVSGYLEAVGMDAESMRRHLSAYGIEAYAQMYLDTNSQDHGEAVQEQFDVEDDEVNNVIRLNMRTRLLDPWRQTPGGLREYRATLCYATTLLPATPLNARRLPVLLLEHPLHHVHVERVLLPRNGRAVGLASRTERRENSAFSFVRTDVLTANELKVSVETRTLATHLPAEDALGALRDQTALQQGHILQLAFRPRGWRALFGRS